MGRRNKSTILDLPVRLLLRIRHFLHFNGVGPTGVLEKQESGFCEDGWREDPTRTGTVGLESSQYSSSLPRYSEPSS